MFEAKVREFLEEAGRIAGREFEMPKIEYFYTGVHSGWADSYDWKLRFNAPMLQKAGPDAIHQTVGHEVAHLIANRVYNENCGHGPKWKCWMRLLQLKVTRCHNYEVVKAKRQRRWEYSCACTQSHQISTTVHNRMQRGQKRRCTKCSTGVEWTGT